MSGRGDELQRIGQIGVTRRDAMVSSAFPSKVSLDENEADRSYVSNISFRDCPITIINTNSRVIFRHIKILLECKVEDDAQRLKLLKQAAEMEAAYGTQEFFDKYRKFMALASDHISVLAPISEALASLLSQ